MTLRSTLPSHPSLFETSTVNTELPVTTVPVEDDLIAVYKRSNSVRRQNLIGIMSDSLIEQLREEYLKELDAAIAHLEEQHHPASIPARVMANEIRADKLSDESIFDILHKTIDLAVTPATSPDFQQKTDDFRKTMNGVKKDAKDHFFYGAAMAFGVAMCLAGIIVLGVLASPQVAILGVRDIIGPVIGLGFQSTVFSFMSISPFSKWKKEKTMIDKMEAFDKAMHEAPAPKL